MTTSMTARELLIYLSCHYEGVWNSIYDHIKKKKRVELEEVRNVNDNLPSNAVTMLDGRDYPNILKKCSRPPFVLWYKGNLSLLEDESRCVAIIGSREASAYGLKMARLLGEGLAKAGYVVVSGLARGIDAAALEAAAPYGKAVAVLGNGLNVNYPSCNRELQKKIERDGLVITEYPFDTRPDAFHFPERNRIIAYVSKMCVVVEAKHRSGTTITIGCAVEAGKDVGAVPFHADEESLCNQLIKDGAALICSADDVIYEISGRYPRSEKEEENTE